MYRVGLSACFVVALALSAPAAPPAEAFADVRGDTFRLPAADEGRAVVLIFFGHDCPISNAYAPEIGRLAADFAGQKVAFCVVYADADLTPEAARTHAKEYKLNCPAILDPKMVLARKVGATVKPEAAVLSPAGELVYRGRIDDLFAGYGKRRAMPTTRELRDAITATLAGKPVAVARTKAIGCDIDFPAAK